MRAGAPVGCRMVAPTGVWRYIGIAPDKLSWIGFWGRKLAGTADKHKSELERGSREGVTGPATLPSHPSGHVVAPLRPRHSPSIPFVLNDLRRNTHPIGLQIARFAFDGAHLVALQLRYRAPASGKEGIKLRD
jgi:hypothetical protein